jgi:hypothetical protein
VSCPTCADKGLLRLPWDDDAEPGIGVCLCPAAAWYRSNKNAGKTVSVYGWQVWCAREQVDPARVYLLEDVLSAEELAEEGLTVQPKGAGQDREAALLAAARKPARL